MRMIPPGDLRSFSDIKEQKRRFDEAARQLKISRLESENAVLLELLQEREAALVSKKVAFLERENERLREDLREVEGGESFGSTYAQGRRTIPRFSPLVMENLSLRKLLEKKERQLLECQRQLRRLETVVLDMGAGTGGKGENMEAQRFSGEEVVVPDDSNDINASSSSRGDDAVEEATTAHREVGEGAATDGAERMARSEISADARSEQYPLTDGEVVSLQALSSLEILL